ncbi:MULTISPECIES: ornithine carbamoyltransferase [unclassified Leptolyngbya]|uniref:ornithine carbamoyltransferase n=1 Tax=unclassified Leptolyngbya TaxID=2650499 RepID=UPI001689C12F|nr:MULTISPECIES: ornithine carbamoyltransferase [unclassified Leptolyngbya]MBD1914230.1 ornithine carbamoyltransferase [Leptolyngbya sp. FACHB-8]MBD2157237.1 ornithine carbamoyltransferase [Leptolyngbya sp. FACHB-16]
MATLRGRDFLRMTDFSAEEIRRVLALAADMKSGRTVVRCEKVLGLLFKKASTRTRVSFSVAMFQMGGQVIDLNTSLTQVSRGEPTQDTARVLDRYVDVLAIRTFEQAEVEMFAHYAKIPVINALTDLEHPCQVLADLLTIQEEFGPSLEGLTLTYVGDGNNMAHSLMLGGAMMGMNVRIASPAQYQPLPDVVAQAQAIAGDRSQVIVTQDPVLAAKEAQVLYTDVWASMGQEGEAEDRVPLFQPYQINDELLAVADPKAIVLHCLPAHREEEITESVLEGPQSRVWDEAENRLHAQKALLASLLGVS